MKVLKFLNGNTVKITETTYEGATCVIVFPKGTKAEKIESIFKEKKEYETLEVLVDETKESTIKGFTCLVEIKLLGGIVKAVLMRESTLNEQRIASAEASAVKAANSAKEVDGISKKMEQIAKASDEKATAAYDHADENGNLITKVNADIDYIAMMTEVEL